MNKIKLLLILLSIATTVYGQVKIIDSLTLEPIVGANIYSEKGIMLGLSDRNGLVDSIKQIPSQHMLITHIAYANKELSFQQFNQSERIYLTPSKIQLAEIPIQNSSKYDYVVIKGYFRTYKVFNNKSRYFYDGIIAYYIPLKNKKKKVQHKLLEYRVFVNPETVNEFTAMMGKAFNEPPILFTVGKGSQLDKLSKDYNLVENGNKKDIMRKGLNMGFVQNTIAGNTQIYFDLVPPQSKITRNILFIKGEIYRRLTVENYAGIHTENPSVENLINKTRVIVAAIKRSKKHDFVPMDSFNEFYVMERTFKQADEIKAIEKTLTTDVFLEEKSSYKEKFWLNLQNYNIPTLGKEISMKLHKELQEK